MSMKDKYLEAMRRADERDAARTAKKQRAAQRAHKRVQMLASLPSSLVHPSEQRSLAESLDHKATESAVSVAPKAAQMGEIQPRTCRCHKEQRRPHDSYGCCKAQIDSIRWTGRVAADTDEGDVARVQALIDSGKVKRAATKAELLARKELGTAAALKEVANAGNKPVAIVPKADLPESVNFHDPNQAHYFAKCAVLRGLNFQLAAKDAYPLLTTFEHSVVASVAEKDPNIRAAIEMEASARGLGDEDKKIFVGLLWKHALSTQPQNFQDRGTAMRILSKAFIEGQPQQQTPAKLEIVGIEEGLKEMFGEDYSKLKDLQAVAANAVIDETEFEEDSEIGE